MDGCVRSITSTFAFWLAGWLLKYAPTSSPYHGHEYSVSAAACTPT